MSSPGKSIISALLLLALIGCAANPRIRPYATDGCSLFPDGSSKHKDLWLNCCKQHDYKYWKGGTRQERLKADLDLRDCVAAVGQPKVAAWMLKGARAGGTPYLPTNFRWGYGWPYPRSYKRVSDEERKLIEKSRPL